MASINLVVSRPFGKYARGTIISDKAEIDEVLASVNAHDVVRVISRPEHDSGDFWRNEAEIKAKSAKTAVKLDKIETRVA